MSGFGRRLASCSNVGAPRSITRGHALQALSPLATLARGYAIVRSDGGALRDAASVRAGDALQVQLASGSLGARVEEVRP